VPIEPPTAIIWPISELSDRATDLQMTRLHLGLKQRRVLHLLLEILAEVAAARDDLQRER